MVGGTFGGHDRLVGNRPRQTCIQVLIVAGRDEMLFTCNQAPRSLTSHNSCAAGWSAATLKALGFPLKVRSMTQFGTEWRGAQIHCLKETRGGSMITLRALRGWVDARASPLPPAMLGFSLCFCNTSGQWFEEVQEIAKHGHLAHVLGHLASNVE